jgi:hypothetical protein
VDRLNQIIMIKYSVVLSEDRMGRLSNPFYIKYSNGAEINFESEGIGFIASVKVKDIPNFLKTVTEEGQFCYNYTGYCFGPITEGEKVWLEKGYVEIYVMETKTILTNHDFFELALQLAHKSLEAVTWFDLKTKGIVDDTWIENIKLLIPQLEAKLKSSL